MTQELIEKFKSKLSSMSYYNAAEGDWSRETEARNKCSKELKDIAKNLKYQGLNPADYTAGFLVSESDYTER